MISDLTASQTLTTGPARLKWHLPIQFGRLAAVAANAIGRVATAITAFAKMPALPYATLFEANVLIKLLNDTEYYEPDPFATESPFITSPWPHD